MPVTKPQAEALATLAADIRPHGARRWDHGETLAALRKLAHLSLADVALALVRAADDRDANSPFAVTNLTSPHWRERKTDRPDPVVRSIGPWCATCGKSQDRHGGDHEFEPPAEKRDGDTVRQIVQALKAEIQPTKTETTHPAHRPRTRKARRRGRGGRMSEKLHPGDPLLYLCEGAPCICGHEALDHAWHGCEECECTCSGIHALLISGVVTVTPTTPTTETRESAGESES